MRLLRLRATTAMAATLALLVPIGVASRASAATDHSDVIGRTPPQPPAQVDWVSVRCAGDTLTGLVQAKGVPGKSLTLVLLQRPRDGAPFQPAHRTVTLTLDSRARARYRYHLPIGGLNALAYQVAVKTAPKHRAVRSPVLPAGECAPGPVVPEAALPLALPLSMLLSLAAAGLTLARRSGRPLRALPRACHGVPPSSP